MQCHNRQTKVDGLIRQDCRVDHHDIYVMHRGSHWDYCVVGQVFSDVQYDIPGVFHDHVFRHHQSLLSRGKIPLVIDAGANIGAGSLWFSHKWTPCHIIAVEPDPGNFSILQINAQGRSIELISGGVDCVDGQAVLIDPGRGQLGYQTVADGAGIPVRMFSVKTLLDKRAEAPFILKLDIEGAEAQLFSSNTDSLSLFPVVVMEPHDWMLPGQKSSVPFYRWHAAHERELVFGGENVFSIDWSMLKR